MFKSIEYIKSLGHDPKTNLHYYEYEITDTDFVEVGAGALGAGGATSGADRADAVINVYSKRNLNVPANLILLFKFYSSRYGWTIEDQIDWCKKYTLGFDKYEKDLEKYLTLI